MKNIATALKSEITRLARKEMKADIGALKKVAASQRSEIAALKRRMADLEKAAKRHAATAAKVSPPPEDVDAGNLRFRATGFAQHRKRLGLSAREMGLLIGASAVTVYNWEAGKARPGANHLQAIATVRRMGKRAATRKLEALSAG